MGKLDALFSENYLIVDVMLWGLWIHKLVAVFTDLTESNQVPKTEINKYLNLS